PRKAKGAIYSLRYILSTSLVSTMTGAKRLSEPFPVTACCAV
ncbi:hypothetical protein ALLO2DRAFT_04477, partial [Frankia sp. Allo2]